MKVLVSSFYDRGAIAPPIERLRAQAEVVFCAEGRRLNEEELTSHLEGVDVIIAADDPFTPRVFEKSPRLRLIAMDGVGVDSVDLTAATRHGVIVNNAPVNYESVADLAFGLMIAAIRKIVIGDRGMRQGRYGDRDTYLCRQDVNGSTLGLMGFGRTARAVARRARGFNMSVLAYDPYVDAAAADALGVKMVSLDELLANSDIISFHVVLTDQTRGMINAAAFAKMKNGVYIVNTSRGAVIDEASLIAALQNGKVAGAGLDVMCNEPPGPDDPLFQFENVVCTAHVGSDTFGTFRKTFESAVNDILLFMAGQRPSHVVNPDVFKHPRYAKGESFYA